ncbi:hypothetical protein QQS21_006972 [Conoideocrella luteorostrata]|uniref:N-acetyltransferase domain-containing protein n=1 Tax=Conoideocrella luteorostrata TaxID=1105319 RepID=A0AAJ0FSH3_9HYPO|nr:hypothetical protein QQS21_006972 [Conoideocrella luteorostrata]
MERGGVRELDLRKCGPGSVAERVGVIPGLRSSAAFFTCLRANLVLSPSVLSSNYNTPYLEPYSPQPPQPQPSPSPSPPSSSSSPSPTTTLKEPLVPLDDIPPLSLDALESQDDKTDGLRLIADSVSEMRPKATKAVLSHPLCLAGVITSWSVIYRFVFMSDLDGTRPEYSRALMLASGITMLYIGAIRFFASRYSTLAEGINTDWLHTEFGGEEDVIFGARAGNALVGALVLRMEPKKASNATLKRKNRSCSASLKGGKGVIRAWTTAPGHRGQGIGRGLLGEAVRYTRDRCGKDSQVGFAQEHANSVMVLPGMFNSSFRRDEMRAAKALEEVVEECDAAKKKKR